ncbi:hypothetical protein O0L34_g10619 [Tuta absoluta]|nr:hypothetical protein O0L34_g10619 [Tuta absoluta]
MTTQRINVSGSCLLCISPLKLGPLEEEDWTMLDFLLHPINTMYPYLRGNASLRICSNCKQGMKFVKEFRKSAIYTFEELMKKWNMKPVDDTSSDIIKVKLTPYITLSSSAPKQNQQAPNIDPVNQLKCTDYPQFSVQSHKPKSVKSEVLSDNEEESEICTVPDKEIKTESVDVTSADHIKKMIATVESLPAATSQVLTNDKRLLLDSSEYMESTVNSQVSANRVFLVTDKQPFADSREFVEVKHEVVDDNIENTLPTDTHKKVTVPSDKKSNKSPRTYLPSLTGMERKYICEFCDKAYLRSGGLSLHKQVKHGNLPPATCPVCNKVVKDKVSLYKHMRVHRVKKENVYCDVCDKWIRRNNYKQHVRDTVKHNTEDGLEARKIQCTICEKFCAHKTALANHVRFVHGKRKYCQTCHKWVPEHVFEKHLKNSLKHASKDDMRFICDDCGKKCNIKSSLRKHILTMHLKLASYKCSQCPKAYYAKSQLNSHVRVIHEKIPMPRNHVCNVCGKGFTNSSLLRSHLPVHTGERPYECGKCDARFGHKSALFLHNRYKHEGIKCPSKKKKNPTTNTE